MADVTATLLGSLADGVGRTQYTLVHTTPGANKRLVVAVGNQDSTANTADAITSITRTGYTFTQIAGSDVLFSGSDQRQGQWWTAAGISSPASADILINFAANQGGCIAHVFELASEDTTTPVPQVKTGTGTGVSTIATSLDSALASASSLVMVAISISDNVNIVPEAGWTEPIGADSSHASPATALAVHMKLNDSSSNPTWSGSLAVGWSAIEVQAAVVAGGQPTMRRWEQIPGMKYTGRL